MKSHLLVPLIAVLLLALVAAPAIAAPPADPPGPDHPGAEVISQRLLQPILGWSVRVPCALGGESEMVDITGEQFFDYHIVITPSGRDLVNYRTGYTWLEGRGQTSGEVYKVKGDYRAHTLSVEGSGRYVATTVHNFRIQGHGADNDFVVHEVRHVTVNADGQVVNERAQVSVDCR